MSSGKTTPKRDRAGAEVAPARGRGRPRSEAAHRAILDATLTLLDTAGYGTLTIEAVAARAGVGKTTIYRRWDSKEELVAEALARLRPQLPPADTGSLRGDFAAFRSGQVAEVAGTALTRVAPRLLGEATGDPALHAALQREIIDPIREVLRTVMERAVERGELPAELDLDLAVDVVHGTVIYRIMLAQGDLVQAAQVVPALLALLARR